MRYFAVAAAVLLLGSCLQPPAYPIEPVIEFLGFSAAEMRQGQFNDDSVLVFIGFTDGDGDLGNDREVNVFVRDLRDDFISDRFRIPRIPEIGANNGISGEMILTLYNTCCIFPDGAPPCTPSMTTLTNELRYEIYLEDRAGNRSNVIQTPPITLHCR